MYKRRKHNRKSLTQLLYSFLSQLSKITVNTTFAIITRSRAMCKIQKQIADIINFIYQNKKLFAMLLGALTPHKLPQRAHFNIYNALGHLRITIIDLNFTLQFKQNSLLARNCGHVHHPWARTSCRHP